MKKKNALKAETLGDYAYQAIGKHFKKSIKHEAAVLKDKDPEPLHQMRVGMRRLRTAQQAFDSALDLPEGAGVKRIKKIAHTLGSVRDLDVMRAELENHYRPDLKGIEQEKLDFVLENLQRQRHQDFIQLEETLKGPNYQEFKQAFQTWLDQPAYDTVANLPILEVLPDLLLPLISQLLLHPGWLVGATVLAGKATLPKKITAQISEQIEQQSTVLHDLRKQMKRVRYQAELFVDFYDSTYAAQVKDFKEVQELLGQIQDSQVLSEFLVSQMGVNLDLAFPSLVKQTQQDRAKAWKAWRPIQQRYLDLEFRQSLRSQVLTPLVSA